MTPRTRLTALLALAGCAVVAALSIGPSASARSSATPTPGGNVVIARVTDSTTMDPKGAFDNEAIWVFQQLYETLYVVTPDGKSVKPWLATSYDLSPDKLTYTFHLRKGVKFHTGQEMTADDVKFSIDAARNPKTGWGYIDVAIKSVTVKDKYTVVIKTKYPWAPLVADIALFNNSIVPEELRWQDREGVLHRPRRHRPVQVGSLDARQGDQVRQVRRLLAEGQAVPGQRHLDVRAQTTTRASCSSRAARRRSTSSRPGPDQAAARGRRASR